MEKEELAVREGMAAVMGLGPEVRWAAMLALKEVAHRLSLTTVYYEIKKEMEKAFQEMK